MSVVDTINGFARKIPTWCVYLIYLLPAPWFFYLGASNQLGPEPINALEREYGEIALQLLIIGLCITPLRRMFRINLLKFRRAIGVCAFIYVLLHLLVWAVLDVQAIDRILADIWKRPYITIGMVAFVLMLPLAATSNNWSVKKLGVAWRKLHRLTYAIVLLGAVHFIWLSKGFQIEPILYLAVILFLLGLRLPNGKKIIEKYTASRV